MSITNHKTEKDSDWVCKGCDVSNPHYGSYCLNCGKKKEAGR